MRYLAGVDEYCVDCHEGSPANAAWRRFSPGPCPEQLRAETDPERKAALQKQIADREVMLMPLYLQIAHEFADLHDRSGRMKAKGVIRDVVPWKRAREYFYWRARRALPELWRGDGLFCRPASSPSPMSFGYRSYGYYRSYGFCIFLISFFLFFYFVIFIISDL